MSIDNFMRYLQQLLSMVDEKDEYSIELAHIALLSTIKLARASNKVDGMTYHCMLRAMNRFYYLVEHADEFRGIPGDYTGNKHKRAMLAHLLQPGC